VDRPPSTVSEFSSGTEAAASTVPLRLKPTAAGALSLVPSARATSLGPGALPLTGAPGAPPPGLPRPGAAAGLVIPELNGPAEATIGQELAVTVRLPEGFGARRAQMDLTFDPSSLEVVGAAGATGGQKAGGTGPRTSSVPGRAILKLDDGQEGSGSEGSVRFRVIARNPGTTQLALDNVVIQDAAGRAMPVQTPEPLQLTLVR
jgi:hypothetical protein